MKPLHALSERAASASCRLVNCNGCTVCCERGGLVYVDDEEVATLESIGVPLVMIGGVTFIQRLPDGSCPMLDKKERKCSIYNDRPLCCRLFPLDVLSVNGRLQWAVSNQCPDEKKHFEGSQGRGTGLGPGSVGRIASAIGAVLDRTKLEYFERKERVLARIDLLEKDEIHWTPVADCECGDETGRTYGREKKEKAGDKERKT